MEFLCEDLPQHGIVLFPPSSPDYDPLLADIRRRLHQPTDGAPPLPEKFRPAISDDDRATSAILVNRSSNRIAALQAVWHFETIAGRTFRHSHGMLSTQSLLLPFGRSTESWTNIAGYWHTVLPGSERYLGESGMVGDNTDVRPPTQDEKWQGGIVTGRGGGGGRMSGGDRVRQVTLVLDGVFFLDGEFVGPNREKLFEQTVADAEAHMIVGRTARDAHNRGLTPQQILAEIEKATGPAPERPGVNLGFRNPNVTPEEFLQAALQRIAFNLAIRHRLPQLASCEETVHNEQTVHRVMGWADAVLPDFRKS